MGRSSRLSVWRPRLAGGEAGYGVFHVGYEEVVGEEVVAGGDGFGYVLVFGRAGFGGGVGGFEGVDAHAGFGDEGFVDSAEAGAGGEVDQELVEGDVDLADWLPGRPRRRSSCGPG